MPIAPNYAKYATPATATAPAHVNNQHARSSALPAAASSAAAVDPEPVDDSKLPPPLALEGYCPVSLLETDTWKKGDPKYGVIHRGRLYLFATAAEKEKFFANPDQYSPVLAGIDPVLLAESGVPVEGKRAHGVVYRKRVYLFDSEDNLKRFWQQPERYAAPIRQAMEEGKVRKLFR